MLVTGIIDLYTCRFADVLPARRAVAGVCAAIGLVMLPVHLASCRERRCAASMSAATPRWTLPAGWILVAVAIGLVAVVVLLVTGHLAYGLPKPDNASAS